MGRMPSATQETNVLAQVAYEPPSIVSTGGGMVLRDVNYQIMRNHGVIVLIDRPLEEIMSDIKLDRRPLLAQKGLKEVPRIYQQRIDRYRAAADAVLDNSQGYYNGVYNLEKLVQGAVPPGLAAVTKEKYKEGCFPALAFLSIPCAGIGGFFANYWWCACPL